MLEPAATLDRVNVSLPVPPKVRSALRPEEARERLTWLSKTTPATEFNWAAVAESDER